MFLYFHNRKVQQDFFVTLSTTFCVLGAFTISLTKKQNLTKKTNNMPTLKKKNAPSILLTLLCKVFWTQHADSQQLLLLESVASVQTAHKSNSWYSYRAGAIKTEKNPYIHIFKWV